MLIHSRCFSQLVGKAREVAIAFIRCSMITLKLVHKHTDDAVIFLSCIPGTCIYNFMVLKSLSYIKVTDRVSWAQCVGHGHQRGSFSPQTSSGCPCSGSQLNQVRGQTSTEGSLSASLRFCILSMDLVFPIKLISVL